MLNAVKKNLSGEKFFHRLSGEGNFSPLSAECGEKNFPPLPAECGEKKIFTAKIANLTSIPRVNFNACLKFTGNIFEVSNRWRSGIS